MKYDFIGNSQHTSLLESSELIFLSVPQSTWHIFIHKDRIKLSPSNGIKL